MRLNVWIFPLSRNYDYFCPNKKLPNLKYIYKRIPNWNIHRIYGIDYFEFQQKNTLNYNIFDFFFAKFYSINGIFIDNCKSIKLDRMKISIEIIFLVATLISNMSCEGKSWKINISFIFRRIDYKCRTDEVIQIKRLRNELLEIRKYDKWSRPVKQHTTPTFLKISLSVTRLADLVTIYAYLESRPFNWYTFQDIINHVMTIDAWIQMVIIMLSLQFIFNQWTV